MNIKTKIAAATAAIGLLSAAGAAGAAEIAVAGVTASSTFFTYNVNHLIDGSGLVGGGLHDGDFHDKWMGDIFVLPTLVFDLGATYSLTSSSIWNYNGGCCGDTRSVNGLTISFSNDNVGYVSAGSFNLSHTAADPFGSDSLGLTGNARYVKFDITSNYGDDYTGLSEVKFFGGAATGGVPEPATWAFMLVGFGGLGAVLRRRRSVAAVAAA